MINKKIPIKIAIDGSFEDWAGTETILDGTDDSLNGNIDIIDCKAVNLQTCQIELID